MRHLTITAAALLVLAACDGPGAAANKPALRLSSDATSASADGTSAIHLSAALTNGAFDSVVTFEAQGVGLLSATNAHVENGVAVVELFAPFEEDLTAGPATTKVIAHYRAGTVDVSASQSVTFTVPTEGAPTLSAHTAPDRVVAGSGDAITIVVDGRRLADPNVTVTVDGGAVTLPATLTLDDALHGEIDVVAPADPADVTVTLTAGDAAAHVVLHFIAADAAAFDLTGTFAQVSYGVISIGGLGPILDPETQCGVAPTFSLVQVVQDGAQLTLTTTMCEMRMPGVNVGFGQGPSTNQVGPGFVRAANKRSPGPLSFTLADIALHAAFHPPFSAYSAPLIMGAELNDPNEDLPTSESDSRVVDDDLDGKPGVTIINSSQGEQHVVSRSRTSELTGTIDSSDAITGSGSASTESNILNASAPLSPTVMSFPSPFYMRRVDGVNGAPDIAGRDGDHSSVSCDDVIAYEDELTAANPAPDSSNACH